MASTGTLLDRWRTGIRLGETAIVIGLWASGVAASDLIIAQVFFISGFFIGAVAIFSDPNGSLKTSLTLVALLALPCLGAEAIFVWRHPIMDETSAKLPAQIIRQVDRYLPAPLSSSAVAPIPNRTYQIVVSEPKGAYSNSIPTNKPQPTPTAKPLMDDYLVGLVKKMRMSAVESKASLECNSKRWGIEAGLIRLQNEAVEYQNQYYKYRSAKQIVNDLAMWRKETEDFLKGNSKKIPDASLYDIAEGNAGRSIFIGDGQRAWLTMAQKRKALAAMQKQLEDIPCDKIGKAAVAECEENGTCTEKADVNNQL